MESFGFSTLWCTLMQLLRYILKCNHLEWRWLFCSLRFMFIKLLVLLSKLLPVASLMSNNFPKQPSDALLHTLSKLHNIPVGFVTSPSFETVLLYLRSPKWGCRSISDDLSCSFRRIILLLFKHYESFQRSLWSCEFCIYDLKLDLLR